jgi:hypothetical protein
MKMLSLQELHKIYPPAEASRKYTQKELMQLYVKSRSENIVPVKDAEIMQTYVKYLKSAQKGGATTTKTMSANLLEEDKATKTMSANLLEEDKATKTMSVNLLEEDKTTAEAEAAAVAAKEAAENEHIQNCKRIRKDAEQLSYDAIVSKYPPVEAYPLEIFQKLTSLKSYPTIYGMQRPYKDCNKLLQFFTFLAEKGIRRYVCLECHLNESLLWKKLMERHFQDAYVLRMPIGDYKPLTFEYAMSILALVEQDIMTPCVFHCIAGFGRTASVMYTILLYMQCKKNPLLLRRQLLTSKVKNVADTMLSKEYSLNAANEFYNMFDMHLFQARINIANQAVANTLQLYYPQDTEIAYIQYDDFQNMKAQSTHFSKRLPQQEIENIIVLADAKNRIPKCKKGMRRQLIKVNGVTQKGECVPSRKCKHENGAKPFTHKSKSFSQKSKSFSQTSRCKKGTRRQIVTTRTCVPGGVVAKGRHCAKGSRREIVRTRGDCMPK